MKARREKAERLATGYKSAKELLDAAKLDAIWAGSERAPAFFPDTTPFLAKFDARSGLTKGRWIDCTAETPAAPVPPEPPAVVAAPAPLPAGPIHACPWHTKAAFDISSMPAIVDWAAQIVRDINADAIVAVGHSGLVVAGAVAYVTRVPVFAVRKPGEPTVAGSGPVSAIAPNGPAQRWIWLDDFIGSGGTFKNAVRELWDEMLLASPAPAAILQYGRGKQEPKTMATDSHRLNLDKMFKGVPVPATVPAYAFRKSDY